MSQESFDQFSGVYTASEQTVQAVHDTYQPRPDFVVPAQPRPESRNGVVETRQYDPRMLKYIAQVTGGDTARLRYNADGSITIANHPQR